jgi:20S proteasome subunit beta 7
LVENPLQHSMGAVNVGTSVMAIRYNGGVMVAADTAISYGGMRKVKDARRIEKLNDECVFASSGEMADHQELSKQLKLMQERDEIANDGACFLAPRDYYNFIHNHNYRRRLKMDPLWCTTIVAGVSKASGEVFLGMSDLYGTHVEAPYLLTGLSAHYCQVLMQNGCRDDMSEAEAKALIENCMRVMFYRDKKALDNIQISTVTAAGVTMHEPFRIDSEWSLDWYKTMTNEKFRPIRVRI